MQSSDDVGKLMAQVDCDGSNTVDFVEFTALIFKMAVMLQQVLMHCGQSQQSQKQQKS